MGFLSEVLALTAPSPENPANPLQPSSWLSLMEGFGGGNDSGVLITDRSAMRLSAVHACVRVLSGTLASMPLEIYERTGRGQRLADDHRLYPVLHNAWNSQMSSAVAVQAVMAQVALRGNGYALIQRDGANRPVALWPLPSEKMRARRIKGRLEYLLTDVGPDQPDYLIAAEDILYIPFLSFDGVTALNPIQEFRQGLSVSYAAERFADIFFSRGSRPSGVLTHPNKLSKEARENLRRSWQEATSGSNALGVALLEEGLKFDAMTVNPSDAQFIETRKLQLEEIARMFGVQPHKIGILERSTNNNIEHQALEFLTDTMLPHITKFEQEFNRKLFVGTRFYAKFNVDGLLRGDFQSRSVAIQTLRNAGLISTNEGREMAGMNPISDAVGGSVVLAPLNMVPLASLANSDSSNAASGETAMATAGSNAAALQARMQRQFSRLFSDATGRMLNREKRDDVYAYRVWEPVLTTLAENIAMSREIDEVSEDAHTFIRQYTGTLAHRAGEWKAENKISIAEAEFDRAYLALTERVQ